VEIKNYESSQFSILQEWFRDHEWEECPPKTITNNAYMVWNNSTPVAFSYYVSTDCNIAFLGFVLSNKKAGLKTRDAALDMLLTHVFNQTRLAGFEYMYFFTDTEAVVKRMKKLKLMQIVNNSKGFKLIGSLNGKSVNFFYE
jgi:hypothetical protein